MNLPRRIIVGLWLLFVAYWLVAAVGTKRSARSRQWDREIGLRLIAIVLIVAFLQSRSLRHWLAEVQRAVGHSGILAWAGVALCLLGFGLAFYARWYLGRNWGPPMAHKERPDLVTGGPYALLRHPIYTGLMLAMLGSALGVHVFWALLLVPVSAYFIHSARREESYMCQLFPEQYPAYRARTGMLLPCPLRRR